MPTKKVSTTRNSRSSNQDLTPADGWANITITDANGNQHRLPKGSPLYLDGRKVEKALLDKATANGGTFEVQATLTITVTTEEPDVAF